MRELNLEATFGCRSTLAEDLENKSSAVNDLALQLVLEVSLLDRRQGAIDDYEFGIRLVAGHGNTVNLTLAKERCGLDCPDRQDERINHLDADGAGEALPFFEAGFGI